ncbi:MAG: hypothetical protein HQL46_12390 [Gammaproteobacteria bacterium]|nr:hypothetical protein [Gammaproteobacteria bacterium]
MVNGLDKFKVFFKNYENSYVLICGTVCSILLDDAGIDFRATKDLDIVLSAEAMDASFVKRFWEFVKLGEYEHQEGSILASLNSLFSIC